MKKVVIPNRKEHIDSHFGHADVFSLYTIEDGKILEIESVESNRGCGCKSDIINILKQKGGSVMLAGSMGEGAYQKLTSAGFEVIRGCHGKIDTIIREYLSGNLSDQGTHCRPHVHHGHAEYKQ